ncbi:hypothetical protein L7F22_010780 [Adiantum nelumboides]|nr:hypothetical protein [Adiantum nelumboides]
MAGKEESKEPKMEFPVVQVCSMTGVGDSQVEVKLLKEICVWWLKGMVINAAIQKAIEHIQDLLEEDLALHGWEEGHGMFSVNDDVHLEIIDAFDGVFLETDSLSMDLGSCESMPMAAYVDGWLDAQVWHYDKGFPAPSSQAPQDSVMAAPAYISASGKAACIKSGPACPQFSGLRRSGFDQCMRVASSFADLQQFVAARSSRGVVTMAGTGKFFVGGNWKCNGTKDSIAKLVGDLNGAKLEDDVEVIVAPPFIYISQVKDALTAPIQISAQNSWVGKGGAFTGEISAEQLKDIGCEWVILGHSERRHVIGETSEFTGKKAAYALSQNLKVIACVGEKLEEREAGKTFDICYEQLKAFADAVPSWDNIVIAYEPVWAIGTGKVATPQQAQEVHAAIRDWMGKNVSSEAAKAVRIIYGGSVNGANCAELAKKEDIDGFLVGGASLKGAEFTTICNSVTAKKAVV